MYKQLTRAMNISPILFKCDAPFACRKYQGLTNAGNGTLKVEFLNADDSPVANVKPIIKKVIRCPYN